MKRITISLIVILLLSTIALPSLVSAEYFEKECMPDFGQHGRGWSWVAAAANVFYWWAKNGYPELLDDPTQPPGNRAYEKDIVQKCLECPEGGYLRLLEEIAKSTGYDFGAEVEPQAQYVSGLRAFISKQGVNLVVTEIGPETFDGFKKRFKAGETAILCVRDYWGLERYHYVTAVSIDDTEMVIDVSDPGDIIWGVPDHNNDSTYKPYRVWGDGAWRVTSADPFEVITSPYGMGKSVNKVIYISPPSKPPMSWPLIVGIVAIGIAGTAAALCMRRTRLKRIRRRLLLF